MEKQLRFHDHLRIVQSIQELLKNERMKPSDFARFLYRKTERVEEQNAYKNAFDRFASPELNEAVEEVRRLQIRLTEIDKSLGQ